MKRCLLLAALAAATLHLAACGGGSSSSPTSTPSGVSGVATPKSVSVVTAN